MWLFNSILILMLYVSNSFTIVGGWEVMLMNFNFDETIKPENASKLQKIIDSNPNLKEEIIYQTEEGGQFTIPLNEEYTKGDLVDKGFIAKLLFYREEDEIKVTVSSMDINYIKF